MENFSLFRNFLSTYADFAGECKSSFVRLTLSEVKRCRSNDRSSNLHLLAIMDGDERKERGVLLTIGVFV